MSTGNFQNYTFYCDGLNELFMTDTMKTENVHNGGGFKLTSRENCIEIY